MTWRLVKVVYFATICLPPPVLLFLYPAIFLRYVHFPTQFLVSYTFYFFAGVLILLVDLWTSRREQDTKIIWTALLLVAGIITLPIYWFRFVLRDYPRA
jgi:hypothetical protein